MNISQLRKEVERKKGQLAHIQNNLESCKLYLKKTHKDQKRHERALALFREVAQKTQEQVQFHLSDLVSMAMNAVFDDPYELDIEFVQRRGKTECDLNFVKDGNKINPLSSSGYGTVDVASFALRVASWFLAGGQTRDLLILDEPFKHLKGLEENRRVIQMVKKISETMGLQVLMVSDERVPKEDIMEGADKVFMVTKQKEKSVVKEI